MKKILMITTGGTIASQSTENGLAPTFSADELLQYMPEICQMAKIETLSLMSIDSSNMNPNHIAKIANTIYSNYNDFDGFVVTHGTDTMSYTASALVYMLQNLGKPVVLTGSQIIVGALFSDAKQNMLDAFLFALDGIPGVFVAFDGIIINGSRSMKYKSKSADAFASINFPIIAEMKLGKISYNNMMYHGPYSKIYHQNINKQITLNTNLCEDVTIVKLFPGIKPQIFDYIIDNYKGVIIESFGVGGIPNNSPDINQKLQELSNKGITVVITTQCIQDGIELGVYEVGNLNPDDIVNAGDMNTEAIVMKLMWALGNIDSKKDIKRFMETPITGDVMYI